MLVASKLSVHPNCAFVYPEYIKEKNVHYEKLPSRIQHYDNYHRNKLSLSAKKKMERAINYLVYSSKPKEAVNPRTGEIFHFKTTFITLTLSAPQTVSDGQIKSLFLNHFLTTAKQQWGLSNYVWKAERQSNCNVHFHILTNVFIPYWQLRDTWNRIQNKLGYVDYYNAKFGKSRPNSTDIHSTKKVRNLAAYVTKYMSKSAHSTRYKVSRSSLGLGAKSILRAPSLSSGVLSFLRKEANVGRIWGCSVELSHLTGGQEYVNKPLNDELIELSKEQRVKYVRKEYCGMYFFDISQLSRSKYPLLFELLSNYVDEHILKR